MLYFGLDGDGIGRIVESMMIENNLEELKDFSIMVVKAIEAIRDLAIDKGASIVFCTGDSILFYGNIDPSFGKEIVEMFRETTGRTASVGIGEKISATYLGLKLAKSKGGNQVIFFR
ncbi:MAG: mCpol domain-containing protein [Saprospiraceae bacterium]